MRIRIQFKKIVNKLHQEEFSGVEKDKKDCSKVKTLDLTQIYLQLRYDQFAVFLSFFQFFPQIFTSWIWVQIQDGK